MSCFWTHSSMQENIIQVRGSSDVFVPSTSTATSMLIFQNSPSVVTIVGVVLWIIHQISTAAYHTSTHRLILLIAFADLIWSGVALLQLVLMVYFLLTASTPSISSASSDPVAISEAAGNTTATSLPPLFLTASFEQFDEISREVAGNEAFIDFEQKYLRLPYAFANFFMDLSLLVALGVIVLAYLKIKKRLSKKLERKYELLILFVAVVIPLFYAIIGSSSLCFDATEDIDDGLTMTSLLPLTSSTTPSPSVSVSSYRGGGSRMLMASAAAVMITGSGGGGYFFAPAATRCSYSVSVPAYSWKEKPSASGRQRRRTTRATKRFHIRYVGSSGSAAAAEELDALEIEEEDTAAADYETFLYTLYSIHYLIVVVMALLLAIALYYEQQRNHVLNKAIVSRVLGYALIVIFCWLPLAISYGLQGIGIVQFPAVTDVSPTGDIDDITVGTQDLGAAIIWYFMQASNFINELWGFCGILVYGFSASCLRSGALTLCCCVRGRQITQKAARRGRRRRSEAGLDGEEKDSGKRNDSLTPSYSLPTATSPKTRPQPIVDDREWSLSPNTSKEENFGERNDDEPPLEIPQANPVSCHFCISLHPSTQCTFYLSPVLALSPVDPLLMDAFCFVLSLPSPSSPSCPSSSV